MGTLACPGPLLPLAIDSSGNILLYLAVGPPQGLGGPEDQVSVGLLDTGLVPPSSTATSESASPPLPPAP